MHNPSHELSPNKRKVLRAHNEQLRKLQRNQNDQNDVIN